MNSVVLTIPVQFWSYFRDLAGVSDLQVELPVGASVADLLSEVYRHHPKLGALRNSTLVAVGVDYQGASYVLKAGDEVSLFPPVQGG